LPLAPRQDLTVTADYIDSTTMSAAFQIRSRTTEVSAVYRTALSNVVQLPGDASIGIEVRGQQNETEFGSTQVAQTSADVAQLLVGWSDAWSDSRWHQSLSLTGRFSPGGLWGGNSDSDFLAVSNGRVGDADYAYADLDYSGDFRIAGSWRYVTTVHAQLADRPLLSTEQMPIGGDPGVRVYVYDDQSFDNGAVWRNELRTPLLPLWTGSSFATVASPYLFTDAGYGEDRGNYVGQWAASAGAGSDWRIAQHLSGGVSGGRALENAAFTHAGGFRLLANVRFTY
jgi:hemolysin activation/secretion protein